VLGKARAVDLINAFTSDGVRLLLAESISAAVPATSSYFTSFSNELGTSFASPLVAGTVVPVLVAAISG